MTPAEYFDSMIVEKYPGLKYRPDDLANLRAAIANCWVTDMTRSLTPAEKEAIEIYEKYRVYRDLMKQHAV